MFFTQIKFKKSAVAVDRQADSFQFTDQGKVFARFPRDIRPEVIAHMSAYSANLKFDPEVKGFSGALLKLKITVVPHHVDAALTGEIFTHLQAWCGKNDATVLMATDSSSGATLLTLTPGNSHKGVILERMLEIVRHDPNFASDDLRNSTACFGDDFGPGRNDTNLFDEDKAGHRVLILCEDEADEGYPPSPDVRSFFNKIEAVYSVSDTSRSVGAYLNMHPEVRVVVSDYDGTIKPIGKGKKPDPETLLALKKILSQGGYVAIATGASHEFLDAIKGWIKSLSDQKLLSQFSVHMYGGNVMLGQRELDSYLLESPQMKFPLLK